MSVKEIERNKRYKIEVVIGYNGSKKIRHTETFHGGLKNARLRENEIKMQVQNGLFVKKENITLSLLIDEYLKTKKEEWAPKTYVENVKISKLIKEELGHIKVKNLNAKILEDFYNDLKHRPNAGRSKKGYSASSVKHFYRFINNALETAIKWDYIVLNPNRKVTPIKLNKTEIECYSPEEVEQLMNVLQTESLKYQAIIVLALDTGCRRGELTGLNWSDIDFDKKTIDINKTTQYLTDYGIIEKTTKNISSIRKIVIADYTMQVLKSYRAEQLQKQLLLGNKWEKSEKVFTTETGGIMHPDTPTRILDKVIKKHNLKKISFHALRHTSISLQIAGGIQSQIISKRAGHSSVQVTHNVYSHFFESGFEEVANTMNNFLQVNNK